MRKLAQPLIFHQTSLKGVPDMVLDRARQFLRLCETRPEIPSWVKDLHLELLTYPPLDNEVNAVFPKLLETFKGLSSLHLATIHDVITHAPSAFFESLTQLKVRLVTKPAVFLSLLSRCPNLTILECESLDVRGRDFEVPPHILLNLKELRSTFPVAQLVVPGRPVEILTIIASPSVLPPTVGDLQPLARGARSLRCLEMGQTVTWSDDCFSQVAALFPSVERLAITFDGGYKVSDEHL